MVKIGERVQEKIKYKLRWASTCSQDFVGEYIRKANYEYLRIKLIIELNRGIQDPNLPWQVQISSSFRLGVMVFLAGPSGRAELYSTTDSS